MTGFLQILLTQYRWKECKVTRGRTIAKGTFYSNSKQGGAVPPCTHPPRFWWPWIKNVFFNHHILMNILSSTGTNYYDYFVTRFLSKYSIQRVIITKLQTTFQNKKRTCCTLDVSRTASYEITLVRLSVRLSVRPSLNFIKIGSLLFS